MNTLSFEHENSLNKPEDTQLLSEQGVVNYIGFVEGDALFIGGADVIVSNGFVGNIAIKSGEGMTKLVRSVIKKCFNKNWLTKLLGVVAYPVFKAIGKEVNASQYNGATLLGLNGVVIKSHGGANCFAFEAAISEAVREVKYDVPTLITKRLNEII